MSAVPVTLDQLISPLRYGDKARLLRDVSLLLSQTNSLQCSVGNLVQNNGYTETLLNLSGTVPIYYKLASYNIPVRIWLLLEYPNRPPQCYVTPTKDMKIKDRHKHVDSGGMVYMPYLHSWTAQSSLAELVTFMSSVFSEDPPVFKVANQEAKPQQIQMQMHGQPVNPANYYSMPQNMGQPQLVPQPQPPAQALGSAAPPAYGFPGQAYQSAQPVMVAGFPSNPSPSPSPAAAVSSPTPTPSSIPFSSLPAVSVSPPVYTPPVQVDPKAIRKDELSRSLNAKLRTALTDFNKQSIREFDQLFEAQQTLTEKSSALNNQLNALREEETRLQGINRDLDQRIIALKEWIAVESVKPVPPIEELVKPGDTWSKQLIEAVAADAAITDTLDCLSAALRDDRIDLANWVKIVRNISRKQFFERALAKKIMQKQAENGLHSNHSQQPAIAPAVMAGVAPAWK